LFTIYITAANYLIKISQKGLDAIRLSVKLSFMFVKYLTESEELPQARSESPSIRDAGAKTGIRVKPSPLQSGLVTVGACDGREAEKAPHKGPWGPDPFFVFFVSGGCL
jgi:hypothetical protein